MEPQAATLEQAIADCGLLLVELDKFRAARDDVVATLRTRTLTVGHRARRLHRDRGLDEPAVAARLLDDALALRAALREAAAGIREGSPFRTAVEAHRAGHYEVLAALLPEVFDDLHLVAHPPPLFHPVAWVQRNRPRPPADVAADVLHLREHGIEADGDALAPGLDPELPAVPLATAPGGGDPVLVRFDPGSLPPAVFRLRLSDRFLVHVAVLRAPFSVVVPETLDPDEVGEISVDHPRYRQRLVDALAAHGIASSAA